MRGALPTSERVYKAVKAELLAGGFSPGERIEAVQLAQQLMSSITPIRAALHRLAGEGLVDARAGEGFQAPRVTEVSLRDLYAWNAHIVQLAWQLWPHGMPPDEAIAPIADADPDRPQDIPAAIAALFSDIGRRSGNEHCAAAIDQLNDRLRLARMLEAKVLEDLGPELDQLAAQIQRGQGPEIRHAIAAYHRRRIRRSAELVRLMHRRSA